MAANPSTAASPKDLLDTVLEDVRAGRFRPELSRNAEFVHAHCQVFKNTDEVSFGRAHSLLWEVHDQAGKYSDALNVIQPLAIDYLKQFENIDATSLCVEQLGDERPGNHREIARQKVMCCLSYGFALYRCQRLEQAKEVFGKCENFLTTITDSRSEDPFHCWGTWARLHYFYGQVLRAARVEPALTQARERFDKALSCVWERLEEVKRQSSTQRKLDVEHLFAKHCAAKVLAFGFGWTSLLQGELAKAHEFLQSARVFLSDSSDEFLIWQLEMFFCNVQRARENGLRDYQKLLDRMEESSAKLQNHPEYYLQSLRHLAVAHCNIAQSKKESEIEDREDHLRKGNDLVKKGLRLCGDNHEYHVIGTVLASRLAGIGKRPADRRECLELAKAAYTRAHDQKLSPPIIAEAAIAFAEALCMSSSRHDWRSGVTLLNEAREMGGTVVRCAAHLHLADLYLKLNDVPNAVLSFARWESESKTVEHEWLRQKAKSLAESIVACRLFWIDDEDKRKYKPLLRDLHRFLIDREKVRFQKEGKEYSDHEAAKKIGVDHQTLRNWEETLKDKHRK